MKYSAYLSQISSIFVVSILSLSLVTSSRASAILLYRGSLVISACPSGSCVRICKY